MTRTKSEKPIMHKYNYMQHSEEREHWKTLCVELGFKNISHMIRGCVRKADHKINKFDVNE